MAILKPQSNRVIGTLAVDGWAVTFGTARTRLLSPILAVPNATVYQIHIIRRDNIIVSAP